MAILAIAAVLVIIVAPQLWVRYTLSAHGKNRPDLPGTGGELALHLIEHFKLRGVTVETTDRGDHYDPGAKVVRLLPQHHDGRSLAAAAIAAHEVAHAIQDAHGEPMLALRQKLAKFAAVTDRFAGIFFIAAPLLAALARVPAAFFGILAIGIALLGIRVIVSIVTLPVEFDASFSKALPILEEGRYLGEKDLPAVRNLLRAAALTYVAGALMSMVNIARWIRLLR